MVGVGEGEGEIEFVEEGVGDMVPLSSPPPPAPPPPPPPPPPLEGEALAVLCPPPSLLCLVGDGEKVSDAKVGVGEGVKPRLLVS